MKVSCANTGSQNAQIQKSCNIFSQQPSLHYSAAGWIRALILLVLLFLAACQPAAAGQGKILLWHGWNEDEASTLHNVLQNFNEIYPGLTVISQAVPANELRQRYEQAARLGLGPDLFIGPGEWLLPLADAGLIQDLRPYAPRTEDYLSGAIESLTVEAGLFGLPLALRPVALYYNTRLVETPATTLDEWLAQAANGRAVALNVNFWSAFWGIQAFGGELYDEAGRVVLDGGGFANWLGWLRSAQTAPGMILSRDADSLREIFFAGKAAYFTGTPDDLVAARAALGADAVSVASLPSGPFGAAGPLLDVEAIYFNQASPPHQTEQALLLAAFLTNPAQSTTLMRETGRVPANRTVQVDPRLYAAEAGFAAQARTAVSIPNFPQTEFLVRRGDDITRSVLEGVLGVTEAALLLTAEVNEATGFAPLDTALALCRTVGTLEIWQPWSDRLAGGLAQAAADYMALCPEVTITVEERPFSEIVAIYAQPGGQTGRPDLILGPGAWVMSFTRAGSIQPLANQISAEMRQRFIPAALRTMELENELYGIPFWADIDVLYYNARLVSDPPVTLAELKQKAGAGSRVGLPAGFAQLYWGATAFGAQLFTPQLRLSLVQTGFVNWLAWLGEAQREPNVFLLEDLAQAQADFIAGDLALLVGPASALGELEAQMPATLGVTRLPAGPGGDARPWLQTSAFFMTAGLPEEQQALALAFLEFATSSASQATLMSAWRLAPVNVNVNVENFPIISSFLRQVNTAYVPPNIPQLTAVLQFGPRVYAQILESSADPRAIACEFTRQVDAANGFSTTPEDLPSDCQSAP